MLNIDTNSVVTKPYSRASASTESVSTETTMMKNDIMGMEKANHVKPMNTGAGAANSPQLTPPAVEAKDDELEAIFKWFEDRRKNSSLDSLSTTLQAIKRKQLDESLMSALQTKIANATIAQAAFESAMKTLENLSADSKASVHDIEQAKKALVAAFEQVIEATDELNESIKELPPSTDAYLLQTLLGIHPLISYLDLILYQMQQAREKYAITVPDQRFRLFKELKLAIQNNMLNAADNIKKNQDTQSKILEAIKWLGVAVAAGLAFLAGGATGLIVGLAMAAIMAVDVAMNGVITNAVMGKAMEKLAPLFEGIVNGLTKVFELMGASKEVAMGLAMVFLTVAVAVGTYVVGAAGSALLGRVAQTAVVQSTMNAVRNTLNTALDGFTNMFSEGTRGLASLAADTTAAFFTKANNALFDLAGSQERFMAIAKCFQVGLTGVATATESGLTIAQGVLSKKEEEFNAEITLLTRDNQIIAQADDNDNTQWTGLMQDKEKFTDLRFQLLESQRRTLLAV